MLFSFNANGKRYSCTFSDMSSMIVGEQVQSGEAIGGLQLKISPCVNQYQHLCYTTDLNTLGLIFKNKTIRSSSLASARLNDRLEKERDGVSEFAGSRFITCFTHGDHESVWFWAQYGGSTKKEKVFLIFDNFGPKIRETIDFEYCLTPDNKKCLFSSSNIQSAVGSDEYDLRAIINSVQLFDIEYLPADDEIFKKCYAGESKVSFGEAIHSDLESVIVQSYDPTCLGKQKTNPWDIEKEMRIMSCLLNQDFKGFDFIDLRLKDEMFRNMKIVLSPWDDGSEKEKVCKIISDSELNEEVKKSISVTDSLLKGTLNL